MGRAALGVVDAGLVQAQGSVDGEANIGGILVVLAIVLPPADRTQGQSPWRLQRLESAARATKKSVHYSPCGLTAKWNWKFTRCAASGHGPANGASGAGSRITGQETSPIPMQNSDALFAVRSLHFHSHASPRFWSRLSMILALLVALPGAKSAPAQQNVTTGRLRVAIVGLVHGHVEGFLSALPQHPDVELVGV